MAAQIGSYVRHLHFTSALSDRLMWFCIHCNKALLPYPHVSSNLIYMYCINPAILVNPGQTLAISVNPGRTLAISVNPGQTLAIYDNPGQTLAIC